MNGQKAFFLILACCLPTVCASRASALFSCIQADEQDDRTQAQVVTMSASPFLRATYCNGFQLHRHASRKEAVFVFGAALSGSADAHDSSRVAMTLFTAKRLSFALTKAIEQHERVFGEIRITKVQDELVFLPSGAITYINSVKVSSTPEELILDLGLNPTPWATGEVVVTPSHRIVMLHDTAKGFLFAIEASIEEYESKNGTIETDVQRRMIR